MRWRDLPSVRFMAGARVDVRPSLQLVEALDPDAERIRVAALVRARRAAENPPHKPWPASEVPMREMGVASVPGAPGKLARRLVGLGWRVVVTYAKGTTFDAQRRPGRVVGSFAIRGSYGNRRCVAIWWQGAAGRFETRGVLVWGDRCAEWVGVQAFEEGL